KPWACSACWYSAPSRYSSSKFLSPITIAGLPVPGNVDDDVPPVDVEALPVALELLDFFDELPHAASVTARTTTAAIAAGPRPRCLFCMWCLLVDLRIEVQAGDVWSCRDPWPARISPRGVTQRCTPASTSS